MAITITNAAKQLDEQVTVLLNARDAIKHVETMGLPANTRAVVLNEQQGIVTKAIGRIAAIPFADAMTDAEYDKGTPDVEAVHTHE